LRPTLSDSLPFQLYKIVVKLKNTHYIIYSPYPLNLDIIL